MGNLDYSFDKLNLVEYLRHSGGVSVAPVPEGLQTGAVVGAPIAAHARDALVGSGSTIALVSGHPARASTSCTLTQSKPRSPRVPLSDSLDSNRFSTLSTHRTKL